MKHFCRVFVVAGLGLLASSIASSGQSSTGLLPPGVKAVWDLDHASREATPTRERICLNGLWRWQPAKPAAPNVPPTAEWGYFKVPGCWPGIADYMQKDCQRVYAHPSWSDKKLGEVSSAWYQREFTVPEQWRGRRISLAMECLNSFATVWVDGQEAGAIRFPGGEADLSTVCQPGSKQLLTVRVTAMPLKGVMLSYSDTFGARQVQGAVERRGLCGDVYLIGEPVEARLKNIKISSSVRRWELHFDAALQGLAAGQSYRLRAQITDQGRAVAEFTSPLFNGSDLKDGTMAFTAGWKPGKLWDVHTPHNTYDASVSLQDGTGGVLDVALPERFGFREFWIEGRDFYLNGRRIFLCAVPLDNAQVGAAWATYEGARRELATAQEFRHQFCLHPQLRLRAGIPSEFCGNFARRRRCGDAGLVFPAAFCALRMERRRMPTRPTATPATPSPTCGWPKIIPRSCSTP